MGSNLLVLIVIYIARYAGEIRYLLLNKKKGFDIDMDISRDGDFCFCAITPLNLYNIKLSKRLNCYLPNMVAFFRRETI